MVATASEAMQTWFSWCQSANRPGMQNLHALRLQRRKGCRTPWAVLEGPQPRWHPWPSWWAAPGPGGGLLPSGHPDPAKFGGPREGLKQVPRIKVGTTHGSKARVVPTLGAADVKK